MGHFDAMRAQLEAQRRKRWWLGEAKKPRESEDETTSAERLRELMRDPKQVKKVARNPNLPPDAVLLLATRGVKEVFENPALTLHALAEPDFGRKLLKVMSHYPKARKLLTRENLETAGWWPPHNEGQEWEVSEFLLGAPHTSYRLQVVFLTNGVELTRLQSTYGRKESFEVKAPGYTTHFLQEREAEHQRLEGGRTGKISGPTPFPAEELLAP